MKKIKKGDVWKDSAGHYYKITSTKRKDNQYYPAVADVIFSPYECESLTILPVSFTAAGEYLCNSTNEYYDSLKLVELVSRRPKHLRTQETTLMEDLGAKKGDVWADEKGRHYKVKGLCYEDSAKNDYDSRYPVITRCATRPPGLRVPPIASYTATGEYLIGAKDEVYTNYNLVKLISRRNKKEK